MTVGSYHINPKTGNPGKCTAQYRCPHGDMDEEHYETKEYAREASEMNLEAEQIDVDELSRIISTMKAAGKRVGSDGLAFDGVNYNYQYILDHEDAIVGSKAMEPERRALMRASKIAKILDKEHPTDEDFAEAERLFKQIAYAPSSDRWGKSNFQKPLNRISAYAESLIKVRKLEQIEPPAPAPQRERNTNLQGLDEAHKIALQTANMHDDIGDSASDYFQNTLNRIANGEEVEENSQESIWETPKHDRVMKYLGKDPNFYLATAWTENELKTSMDKAGVKDVEVKSFYNSREWGNVYTVARGDGDTMSFSVYEHRNTDAIIINGKTNWDGEELPYVGDSKYQFFAELPGDDKQKAADVLTFFMKEAQKGELANDVDLANSAMRMDWDSILRKQLPGFGEWADKNSRGSRPQTEQGILDQLDFD